MRIKYFDKDYIEIDDIKSLARHFSNAHIHMWIEGCGSLSSFAEVQLVKSLSPILLSLLEINKENLGKLSAKDFTVLMNEVNKTIENKTAKKAASFLKEPLSPNKSPTKYLYFYRQSSSLRPEIIKPEN